MAVGCTSKKVGIMFLTEVALGKPYRITRDDPTLCQPPAGYDSVLACGRTEPGEPGAGEGVGVCGAGAGMGLGVESPDLGLDVVVGGVFLPRPCAG